MKGFRGAKSSFEIELNGKSIVLYGDNGTGKSSLTDSFEWYYTDKVTHLSGREIKLQDALRNASIEDEEDSTVTFEYSNNVINNCKTLNKKGDRFSTANSNQTDDFKEYIERTQSENIILRYQFLTDFIDNTKGDKLKYLSNIIGYSEVIKKKDVLGKSYRHLKTSLTSQNFEGQIATQKQILVSKLGATVSKEEDFINALKSKLKVKKIDDQVNKFGDINEVLITLKTPINKKLSQELDFLTKVKATVSTIQGEIAKVNSIYDAYHNEFQIIAGDVNSIRQTFLNDLLLNAKSIISRNIHVDPSCPLCLQSKDLKELSSEIESRLQEIEEAAKKKRKFDSAKNLCDSFSKQRIERLTYLKSLTKLKEEPNKEIEKGIDSLIEIFTELSNQANIKVTSGINIKAKEQAHLSGSEFQFIEPVIIRIKEIEEQLKKDNNAEMYADIVASRDSYLQIQNLIKEKTLFVNQYKSLELIYDEFVKVQKQELENFINTFSERINEFYQFMNPDAPFQEIRIVTIGEEDELDGITVEYRYNNEWVSPPQKYFSESHLNCFGLAFFLASVEAFNQINKFIVLDDVISSFDSTHRKRFADLIFKEFSDYQIILLTHEIEWFKNMVTPLAKSNGWLINEIKWTLDKGTHLDVSPLDLKDHIVNSLADSKIENLGNPIRKYIEHSLKDIAFRTDSKMSFQYNQSNEQRMPNELLQGIRSEIKKRSPELKSKFDVMDRISSSSTLSNFYSHDSTMHPKIGDIKALWADIQEFENIFICQEPDCRKRNVSLRYYDSVEKKIRCGCGKTKYEWKG